jgi:hypothetical protein
MSKIVLVIELAEGVEAEDVVLHMNCDSLCELEEAENYITGWEWIY